MELANETFRELAGVIRAETGMVLGPEKAYLVHHRLEGLVRSEGLTGFEGLAQRLRVRTNVGLRKALIDAITVKETRFFRDQAFFDALKDYVLPECASVLARAGRGRQHLRVWSAAASTGQEAYSVAMILREFIETNPAERLDERRFSILASDISDAAIDAARAGLYSESEVGRGLSADRLKRYFAPRARQWCIDESLRRNMQFRTLNLLDPPSDLGAFDLILCRNVLIYFDAADRGRVCRWLFDLLHDGGWLALGSAESLHGLDDRFETIVMGKSILYQKPVRPN